jgi:anaerobic selenocysteine-containing dehydrogenase
MQPRIDTNLGIADQPDAWVHSACILCSNGCGLDIAVQDGRIVGVRGSAEHPVNFGHLGPKGEHGWVANNAKRRGTAPMIRRKKSEALRPVSWPEATDFFIDSFRTAWKEGHQNLACYNSGQLTIEELYTLGKLWRGGLQSSNIDGNTRLCTATSATGLMANFGTDGPVASYADIDQADLLCLYGHNVAEAQTVLWERMLSAKQRNGARIIVVDPRKTPTVHQGADLHLQLRPGANVALMNGIIHLLVERGWVDRDFISQHTVGFAELEAVAREYPPARVADICDIAREDLEKAAEWIGTTPRFVSTVLQGFYQSVEATASSSLVNSVHLITGAIGKPGAGPLLMAGQPSAMCNREAGAGGSYPAYRNPHSEVQMRDLCKHWNLDFDRFRRETPKDILSMMETAERGEIEFLWVVGTNPLVSLPDQNRSERILRKLFLVVQDPFIDAETVDLADIYFPAAMWGEKSGCVTNADRSVNLLMKAVEPPGQARSDFDIFVEVANELGFKDRDGGPLIPFAEPKDAFEEWRKVSKGRPCDYSGMTYELILEMGAVRWPCNERHPRGAERLYEDLKFRTGIDECETYGVDFLTRRQDHPRGLRAHRPEGQGVPAARAMAASAQSGLGGISVRADHRPGRLSLPHANEDGPVDDPRRTRPACVCRNPSGGRCAPRHRSRRSGRDHVPERQMGGRGHGGRHRPTGRSLRTVPLWTGRSVGQPAHLVCARPRQPSAAVEIVSRRGPPPRFRPAGPLAAGTVVGAERRVERAVRREDLRRYSQSPGSALTTECGVQPSSIVHILSEERQRKEKSDGAVQRWRSRDLELRSGPRQRHDHQGS